MSPATQFLLEDCFWNLCDSGVPPDQTPLLSGFLEETPLTDVLCTRFGISREEAEAELIAAQNEVAL